MSRHRRLKASAKSDGLPAVPGFTSFAVTPVLKAGVGVAVQTVRDMHLAIADKAFSQLRHVPGLSLPSRIVQGIHDGISHGVYAAVQHGSGALMAAACAAERVAASREPAQHAGIPTGRRSAVRSALNGVFGDALARGESPMTIVMGLHRNGMPWPASDGDRVSLAGRVCLFIHGLACDETSWQRPTQAWIGSRWEHALPPTRSIDYGALLESELGFDTLHLRYNTGLPIAENARRLSELLAQWLDSTAPQPRELVLIGHSMGGLVARSACDLAARTGARWLHATRMVICLGSPHQGAPLEKLGHVAGMALGAFDVTRPLARIGNARSQGIQDLRHGLKATVDDRPASGTVGGPALRFIAASLADDAGGVMGSLLVNTLGDGLVRTASATDEGLEGDVQRTVIPRLGHMALLNHPRVYAQIRDWLAETSAA